MVVPLLVALLLVSSAACAAAPRRASPETVFSLSEPEFRAQAEEDLKTLLRNAAAFELLAAELTRLEPLLTRRDPQAFSPDEKHALLSFWASFFDHFISTELIRQRYWDFLVQPASRRTQHVWGFVATHTALTLELAHGLAFAELTVGHPQLEVLLDEPSEEYGVPKGAFARLKQKAIHAGTSTQLMTGDAYEMQLRHRYRKAGILDSPTALNALGVMRDRAGRARMKLGKKGVVLVTKAGLDLAGDQLTRSFFPVQRGVAEWMGDTRVRRKGQPLISREQALELAAKLQPGDIIVARQNWYLSNIGLPGFWPHAELYLGTREELDAAFDSDAEVKAWLATLPGKPLSFSAHLAAAFPGKWKLYSAKDEHGDPIRILESISEGVSFTGIEHGMRVDYVAAMRPRISKLEKAKAIERGFGYQGRPYDFNFDFYSDATLVCTELVYKAYAPSSEMKGVALPLVKVAGRQTLPANEIVKLYAAERGREDRQLDFVGFIDGREESRTAEFADAAAFAGSYRRVKWDVAQK